MTSSFSNKLPMPPQSWLVSLCRWLWARLQWIWGFIILGAIVNIGSTWLTLPSGQFNLTRAPIGWLLEHPYITIPFSGGLIVLSFITCLVTGLNRQPDQRSHSSTLEKQEGQNRNRFLKRLRRNYNGSLKQSLQENVPPIALSFQRKPDLVQNNTHQPKRPGSTLPVDTSILQVYDEADGELLILGEPGSGKTTLLLRLARDLRDRAEQNPKESLPVIVNLSTWKDPHGSLEKWLIEEVARMYDVPPPISTYLIEHDQLLPLLDGLDEMPHAMRLICVKAINIYQQNHLGGPLVVCCRAKEYSTLSALGHQLELQDAVIVQPLEEQQIDDYFQTKQIDEYIRTAGGSLHPVKEAYRSLCDLVNTPLMLHMLILLYKDKDKGTQPLPAPSVWKFRKIRLDPVESQQKLLLEYYLDSRLEKYDNDFHVSPEQVKRQLIWLAQQMRQHNLKTFHIEHMQSDWLQETQAYERYAVRWSGILMGVLLSLLVNALLFNSFDSMRFIIYAFIGGHIGSLFSRALIGKQAAGRQVRLFLSLARSLGRSILIGLGVWLSTWFTVGQAYLASDGLHNGLATGLCCAVSCFLLSLLFQRRSHNRPNPPSSGKIWQELVGAEHLGNGILVGLSVGLAFGLITGLFFTQQDGLVYGLTFGVRDGLTYGLTFGLIGTLLSIILTRVGKEIHPTEILTWSWRSLWESLLKSEHWKHTILVGLSVGLGTGVSLGLSTIASQWLGGRGFGFDVGLAIGLGTSLGDGLAYGLTFGIAYWLLLGLFRGLSSNNLPPDGRIKPNEGIWRSLRIGVLVGLSGGMVSGLIGVLSMMLYFGLHAGLGQGLNIGLSLGWHAGLNNALHMGLHTGLVVGLQVGLFGGLLACALMGGLACLRHYVLRLLLWQSHRIPFDYPRFLDGAARCILLRKVGGGYEFFHDLLLEHLLH